MKVSVPSALTTTLPSAASTLALVTARASLSASLSLSSTATVAGACATVLALSLLARGASLAVARAEPFGSLWVARPNSTDTASRLVAIVEGVTDSTIRSTRRPGCMSPPLPPSRPAAGASSALTRSPAAIARSTGAAARAGGGLSPVIMTIAFCSVRISAPGGTVSPSVNGRHTPSVPRT
jgi:hypothetical protein